MGIAAAAMYAQLPTGKPLHIISRVRGEKLATEMFVSIDTTKNRPELHKKAHLKWDRPHGTRVEADLFDVTCPHPSPLDSGSELRSRQLLLHCSTFAHPWARTSSVHGVVLEGEGITIPARLFRLH